MKCSLDTRNTGSFRHTALGEGIMNLMFFVVWSERLRRGGATFLWMGVCHALDPERGEV